MLIEMAAAIGAGTVAGLGVAMPLGAVAALIVHETLARGRRAGLMAATGVAVVDLAYAAAAVTGGAALATWVEGRSAVILVLAGCLLVALGMRAACAASRGTRTSDVPLARTGLRFAAITALNPLTVVYFVALGVGVASWSDSIAATVVFVVSVGLSSWCWQLGLVFVSGWVGGRVGERAPSVLRVAASVMIMLLGLASIVRGLLVA